MWGTYNYALTFSWYKMVAILKELVWTNFMEKAREYINNHHCIMTTSLLNSRSYGILCTTHMFAGSWASHPEYCTLEERTRSWFLCGCTSWRCRTVRLLFRLFSVVTRVAHGQAPSEQSKNKGSNAAFSTSSIRASYFSFFDCSWLLYRVFPTFWATLCQWIENFDIAIGLLKRVP